MSIFHYKARGNSVEAFCGIDIRRQGDGTTVVVLTERPDNPGMSVTNAVEDIAEQVCRKYSIDPNQTMWIEVYPKGFSRPTETTDLVTFESVRPFRSPSWRRITPEDCDAIVKKSIRLKVR